MLPADKHDENDEDTTFLLPTHFPFWPCRSCSIQRTNWPSRNLKGTTILSMNKLMNLSDRLDNFIHKKHLLNLCPKRCNQLLPPLFKHSCLHIWDRKKIHINTAKGPRVPTMVNSLVSTLISPSHPTVVDKPSRGTAFSFPLRSKDSNCEYLQLQTPVTSREKSPATSLEELAQWQGLHQLHPPEKRCCHWCRYDSLEILKTNHRPAIPDCWLPTISS